MKAFKSASHKNKVYELMLERIDCGPFDGGCVVFAQALQHLYGGDLYVVEGRCLSGNQRLSEDECKLLAQHAVLKLRDGRFIDAGGAASERAMLARTAREANFMVSAMRLRPLREDDLEEAPRDAALAVSLAKLLDDGVPAAASHPAKRAFL